MLILRAFGAFGLLIFLAAMIDKLLHSFGYVIVGRYLGYIGTVLILLSFIYSLKKRKYITVSSPKVFLQLHEILSWIGTLFVIVHGGIHFNALVPWLALGSMMVVVASGLTGKYLLSKARLQLEEKIFSYKNNASSSVEVEKVLFFDALLVDSVKHWRNIHLPITFVFALLVVIHIVSEFYFWSW